jgi:transglutaminase-like putative cysteine protease
MTLMPAKLARREKHAGDYWGLHAAGLASASLAGALAEDPVCFILIGLYAVCAVWSLSLFYLRRAGGAIPPVPGKPTGPPVADVVGSFSAGWLRRALVFTVVAVGFALPLYLITPRSPADKLDLGKPRIEIGYAADQMIDLNHTGNLQANREVAFEVTAVENGHPKTDLSPQQRWRGRMLRRYTGAVWQASDVRLPGIEPTARTAFPWSPPRLGPGQFTLHFTIPATLPGLFLADPVAWVGGEPSPIATLTPNGPRGWIPVPDGMFVSGGRPAMTEEPYEYVQVWRAGSDPDLGPAFQLTDPAPEDVFHPLCQNPVPRVKEYADAVLQGLVRSGQLPADFRDRARLMPRAEFHERIARAFSAHLATTPELSYTTNIRRDRRDVDPIEDFLFHSRAGHCERFATALALMLRSQDIPAVLILGFKGCEPTDEPGRYLVRQEHAHAWVQALVPVTPQPRGSRPLGPRLRQWDTCRWISLDPTPLGSEEGDAAAKGNWVERAGSWLRSRFHEYFVNYTAEQRRDGLLAAARWLSKAEVLAAATGLVVVAGVGRWFIRRRRWPTGSHPAPEQRWFGRLLAVLAAHGFAPAPGETPREFATGVTESLRRSAATAGVAEVPLDWAEAYYESRFGGTAIAPDRLATLDARLRDLERALPG